MKPAEYPAERYSFEGYNSKHRMLTYWHQIKEITDLKPRSVLEIGVGTGLVAAYIRSIGVHVETVDINPSLHPDHVGSVLGLDKVIEQQSVELVLCARVLHHLDYKVFSTALQQIAYATSRYAVITLPLEDFRIYFMCRYTSSRLYTCTLPFPVFIKRMLFRRGAQAERRQSSLWKINDSKDHSLEAVTKVVREFFDIIAAYRIPEDSAHYVMVLSKRSAHEKHTAPMEG